MNAADKVADCAYTQLQIDPVHHKVIAPQPTPAQRRQMQLEREQRELQARIDAERAKLEQERQEQIAQLQAERLALKEQQRLMRSASSKTIPSTDFVPVSSSRKASLVPDSAVDSLMSPREPSFDSEQEHQQNYPREQQQKDPPVQQPELPLDHRQLATQQQQFQQQQRAEDVQYEEELYMREQHLLHLQQQKEFRDLQHQQQLLYQRHQQQMLQQQAQHQERLRMEEQLRQARTPPEIHIPPAEGAQWQASTGVRESVEMSPMSPPVFQFLHEPEEAFYAQNDNYSDTVEAVLRAEREEQQREQGAGEAGDGMALAQEDDYSADADFAASGSERQPGNVFDDRVDTTSPTTEDQPQGPQGDERKIDHAEYEVQGLIQEEDAVYQREEPSSERQQHARPPIELALNCDSPDSTPHTALSSSNQSLTWSPFPVPAVLHPQPPSPAAAKQSHALELLATEDQSGGVFAGTGVDVFAGNVPPLAHQPAQFSPQRRTPTTRRQDRPAEPQSGESQKHRFEY